VDSLKIIKSQTQNHRTQRTTIQCKRRADQAAERERGNGEDDNSAEYIAVLIPRRKRGAPFYARRKSSSLNDAFFRPHWRHPVIQAPVVYDRE
jgi:hypothetical protein